MNKNIHSIILLILTALVCSCTSASFEQETVIQNNTHENQDFDFLNVETTDENFTQVKKNSEDIAIEYSELVSSVILTPHILPSPSVKGNAFKKPFTIKVTNAEGQALADFPITVEYPQSIIDGTIQFEKNTIVSNDQGLASFISPPPSFSCNSVIEFYPSPSIDIPELNAIIHRISLKIPYLVKTNLTSAVGSICLVDYDKEEKAITNNGITSSAVLINLIRSGFSNIGNADFYKEVASGDYATLYNEAKKLFGSAISFFIFGTVKYTSLTFVEEDGLYYISLQTDVICIDMKDNTELYKTSFEVCASGKTEQSALHAARNEQLAPMLAEKLLYGM